MKINVEMDIPIMPNHCPSLFFLMHINHSFSAFIWKEIYKYVPTYFTRAAPVWGKTIWICVASQTILIKSYWLGIEQLACRRGAPDPSGSRSLMSSTAGFTAANLFNKALARMLQGLILIQRHQTVCGRCTGHRPETHLAANMMAACVFFLLYQSDDEFHLLNSADACDFRRWHND